MTKRTLRVLPVIFLSMICLMLIVFGCLGAIRENGRIQVGVVLPEQDTMAAALVNTIKNMGELSSLCDFSQTTEKEGKDQLEQGEISALIVIPEKILQKIYQNANTSISMYMPDKPTLESAIVREFAEAGSSLILTAKAGDYTAYNMYQKYGKAGTMQDVARDMNGRYIQFVLRQETLFQDQPVTGWDELSDADRMTAAGVVLILFLLGIPVANLHKKQPAVLSLQLARKGIRPLFSTLLDVMLITFVLFFPMVTGILLLGAVQGWDIWIGALLCGLFLGCLMYAVFLAVLGASGQDVAGSGLLIFFSAPAQIFLAGGIFPVSVLPVFCVRLGNMLPGGLLIKLVHQGLTGEPHTAAVVGILGYTILFFAAALWIMAENRRRCV